MAHIYRLLAPAMLTAFRPASQDQQQQQQQQPQGAEETGNLGEGGEGVLEGGDVGGGDEEEEDGITSQDWEGEGLVEEEERALGLSGRCADMLTLMACRVCDPEVCVCVCVHVCVCTRVCVCVRVCMCLYVYIRMSGCECVYVRSVCWVCADRR